jgi:general secretion pathway protein G
MMKQWTGQVTSRRAAGFSLMEIMVVLVIIGMLAGLVTINVRGYMVRAKQNAARAEIATICQALETFYSLHDRYPTNDEGLAILSQKDERSGEPLLSQAPVDPWRHPYQYNQPGRNGPYEVLSLGADGKEGGEESSANADIGSWDPKEKAPS